MAGRLGASTEEGGEGERGDDREGEREKKTSTRRGGSGGSVAVVGGGQFLPCSYRSLKQAYNKLFGISEMANSSFILPPSSSLTSH